MFARDAADKAAQALIPEFTLPEHSCGDFLAFFSQTRGVSIIII
jgi:hypothetical protein